MGLPAFAFDGARYVSDALELLLDAGDARRRVRSFAVRLLDRAPPSLKSQLEPVAAYVGGKCMGYPAIWFLEQMLDREDCSAGAIVERCRGSLCMSLSTSIVDDLADRDEDGDTAYLAYLYILLGEAAFGQSANATALQHLHRAVDACLNPGANGEPHAGRGDRIGAFYAMIAAQVLEDVWDARRAATGIEAARAFGEICAHLDDWMDAERDLARGTTGNVALSLLRERLGGRILAPSSLLHYRALADDLMASLLATSVEKTAALLATLQAARAMEAMVRLGESLQRTEAEPRESACRVAGA
jgi:hypothetical protein